MLRFLLVVTLIVYVLYKLGAFRIFTHTEVRGQRPHNNFNKRPSDGNVNIDYAPPKDKKSSKGGEYVDYEEVK